MALRIESTGDSPRTHRIDGAVVLTGPGFSEAEGENEHFRLGDHAAHGGKMRLAKRYQLFQRIEPPRLYGRTERIKIASVLLPHPVGRLELAERPLQQLQQLAGGID